MTTANEIYERKRANLSQVRDEFRRLSIQYRPLYHERFLSPLDVSEAGWKEFIAAAEANSQPFPSTERQPWEEWYVDPIGRWAGRFYGAQDGFAEFESLCDSLSRILNPGARLWPPVTGWVRVLHEMAENCPTPLLRAPRRIWNFPREDYLALNADGTLIEKPRYIWAPTRRGCAPYPKHPLRRALRFNLFSSSVAAIEIILAPEKAYFLDDVQPEDLPVVLAKEEACPPEESQVKIEPDEHRLLLTYDKDFFPFLFTKVGCGWIVRFWTGEKMEKAIIPEPQKGCRHYQTLLTNPGKSISALELDPPKESELPKKPEPPKALDPSEYTPRSHRSFISENEFYQESGDVEWYENQEKFYAPVDDEELNDLVEQKENLESQIENETNKTEKKRLKDILKALNKSIHEHWYGIQDESKSARAFRRVKSAMQTARVAMERGKELPAFLDHLHRSLQEAGHGYRYDPKPVVEWKTDVSSPP
jgi:hypothetical protein